MFNSKSIAKSRNIQEFKISQGNWIKNLDSDDYWHQDKLKYVAEKQN